MTMSFEITMILVAIIACAPPALAEGNGNDSGKSAQYCVPQYDNSDGLRIYC
jgi:hypothetical protein